MLSVKNPFSLGDYLTQLEAWTRDELPHFNCQIEDGEVSVEELIAVYRPWVDELHSDLGGWLDRWQARRLIQMLGFGVSSIERHLRGRGQESGSGLAQFPYAENLLVHLAGIACHPPRDSHYTYWLWNDNPNPLTFTGNQQEVFFNRVVNNTALLHGFSCDAVRPICQGNLSITSPETVEAMRLAADNTLHLYEQFRSFMHKNADGQRQMEPDFFMTRMRTYLPTYPIGGSEWGGVNAANLAAQMQMDYLIGTIKPAYHEVVHNRFCYLTHEDQVALSADMELPSLLDVFLVRLRLSPEQVEQTDKSTLKAYIATQPTALQNALIAYKDLVNAAARLTAMHWSLIHNYLVRPARNLTPEERIKLAVQPDEGTGGASHAETEAIMNMRREHPIVWKLIEAVNG